MTVGEKLKRERKKQKLSLETISEKTKIGLLYLIAIEEDEITKLPGGIYSRNFLRAYAACLDLDIDLLTAEFHEQHRTKPTSVLHQEQTTLDNRSYLSEKKKGILFLVLLFSLVLILGFAAYFFYKNWYTKLEQTRPTSFSFSQDHDLVQNSRVDPHKPEPKTQKPSDKTPGQDNSSPHIKEGEANIQEDSPTETKQEINALLEPPSREIEETEDNQATAEKWPAHPIQSINSLPILNIAADNREAISINDVFIVFAEKDVWLEVTVDGVQVTRRLIPAGDFRIYYYGEKNEIVCGDFARVSLQDGPLFLSTDQLPSGVRETLLFKKYGLASRIQAPEE